MITLRFDAILQAVSIERGDNQRVYCPKPASMRRLLRLACQSHWLYRPQPQYQIFVWEMLRFKTVQL
jgi:hypothetical protein